jgi:uncharacterized protein with FMN-binding domain
MKRAPIVLTGTAVGLAAVVGYHSASPQATLASGSTSLSSGTRSGSSGTTGGGSGSSSSSAGSSTASSKKTLGPVPLSSSTSTGGTRTAVGADYQYPYGDLAVEVTVSGSRITNVAVVKHNTNDPQSAMIDQYAIPILRNQALQVQSAKINGISGASFTSAAYAQSLQSALDKLKV